MICLRAYAPSSAPNTVSALASCAVLGVVLSLFVVSEARAAGFAIADQGAGASGLASSVTARAGFAASHVYNPAGVLAQDAQADTRASGDTSDADDAHDEGSVRVRASVGVSVLFPSITHTAPGGEATRTESSTAPVPFASLSVSSGRFGGGVYVAAPYGSSLTWPAGWSGRYEITSTSLQVVEVGANIMGGLLDSNALILSVGPRLQVASLSVTRDIDVVDPERDARVAIQTQDAGLGVQFGALYRPLDALRIGLSVRSQVTHNLKGRADFQDIPVELTPSAHDSDVRAELTTPLRAALGVAYTFGGGNTLSLDLEYTAWSSFDRLVFDFTDDSLDDVVQPRRWTNTLAARLGYDHPITDTLTARAGAAYDPSPAPAATLSPSSPDSDRITGSLGLGWQAHAHLRLDLAAVYTAITRNTVSDPEAFPGSFEGRILTGALGVSVMY